ncbi:MAG: glycine cleavage system protein GcvH [Alphaproteobacteria bacterium]|jgi:glycine cleavage system H protein|nr:glycine cleavage system protein GcvH [Alphaproteobacteria bacterium]
MSEVRFTDQHEWVRLEGDEATVGITRHAAEQLGDVVFVELPQAGRKVGAGAEAAVVESVKAASEVYAPVGGEVTAANGALEAEPAKVNEDPEGAGWFFKLKLADKAEFAKLMDAAAYQEFVKGL